MIRQKLSLEPGNRAVSPVIGVILMVAITVILAAVIGAFVLDLGSGQESTPQASITIEDAGGGDITITHDGGDTLSSGDFRVTADGSDADENWPGSELAPGNSVTISSGVSGGTDDVTVRIVHKSSGGVIAETTVDLSS